MRQVELGRSGLSVSAVGLGCMPMSQSYGPAEADECERALHRALDIGVTFLDTADAYGAGKNETLIGEVLGARRSEITLATKFANRRTENGWVICGRPEYVREACDASLSRLGVDHIDLYYLHRLDKEVPIEETVGAMGDLVRDGKVRFLGLSEVSSKTLRRAVAEHPIAAVQSEYSLWTRDPEAYVLPTCRELGVGFVPFSPLGRAILTGKVDGSMSFERGDSRARMPRFQGENFATNLELVSQFVALAETMSCSPAQLALAWLMAQPGGVAPIPGTKRLKYVEENAGAADIELTDEQVAAISEVFSAERVAGARYDDRSLQSVDADEPE